MAAGIRVGVAPVINIDDCCSSVEYGLTEHISDEQTFLKNKYGRERSVSLRADTCEVLDDYIKNNRFDTTDGYDRERLFTSRQARCSVSSISEVMYR